MQTHTRIPPAGLGPSAHVDLVDPFTILERIRSREALADKIHEAIAFLDAIDADPDLEPSLAGSSGNDLEGDGCDDELTGDDEPSLGSFDCMVNQEHSYRQRGFFGGSDRELDRCDHEDGGDTEPNGDEEDFSDHTSGIDGGIGDADGLLEQTGIISNGVCGTACL